MRLPYYQVDSFAGSVFTGNPAGVCPLESWLEGALLQSIAFENGLSETAFFVPRGTGYDLKWFTPEVEVDLCGHGTLASAFIAFTELGRREGTLVFHSRSGPLRAEREGERLILDFPSRPASPAAAPAALISGLGGLPVEVLKARDYLAVFESEADVAALSPNFAALRTLDCLGVIATAPGTRSDFVSRFFAPGAGVPEDPVTGSAHCTLIPYWSSRLGKKELRALQVSRRGGELFCSDEGERVKIGGRAVIYLRGSIEV